MSKKIPAFISLLFCSFYTIFAQLPTLSIEDVLQQTATEFGLSSTDIADVVMTDQYTSSISLVQHTYLRQRWQGIEIQGANASLHHLPDGKLLQLNNDFLPNLANRVPANLEAALTAEQVVLFVAKQLGYSTELPLQLLANPTALKADALFSNQHISQAPIPVKLMLMPTFTGDLHLVWDLAIAEVSSGTWWNIQADAHDGRILKQTSWTHTCQFECSSPASLSRKENAVPPTKVSAQPPNSSPTYQVFPFPIENPNRGSRMLISETEDAIASPYGWHDTNGAVGAEYTITKGNNADVSAKRVGELNYSPDGGTDLQFDFPYAENVAPSEQEDAIATNVFYWINTLHDLFYQQGFTEVSGNFQHNNYGRNGVANDAVKTIIQDDAVANNARFSAPPDGFTGFLQLSLFGSDSHPSGFYDSGLDNGIIAHELGHGISNRLAGGPSNASCLGNEEQMGEGWSDWFALLLTIQAGDTRTDSRGIGTYLRGQDFTQSGIRRYPYNTNLSVNPLTYADLPTASVPHGVGAIWGSMLWEMTWNLIDEYGFDPDWTSGTGGNNIALKLVLEGIKLQACRPGFRDARNAILAADEALYNEANACLIWRAFAKRGLGQSAGQGSSNDKTDGTADFTLPHEYQMNCTDQPIFQMSINPKQQVSCVGESLNFTLQITAYNGFSESVQLSAPTLPTGTVATFNPAIVNTFPTTVQMTIDQTQNAGTGRHNVVVEGNSINAHYDVIAQVQLNPADLAAPNLTYPIDQSTYLIPPIFQWNAVNYASHYRFELARDLDFTEIIHTAIVTQNTYDLQQPMGGNYYWRVSSLDNCSNEEVSPIFFFAVETCGSLFTDSGGENNSYKNSENEVYTICTENGAGYISVKFTEFAVQADFDYLSIYDGKDRTGELIGMFTGTDLPQAGEAIESYHHSGCLTFVFESGLYGVADGWVATVNCFYCTRPTISNITFDAPFCNESTDGEITVTANGANDLQYVLKKEDEIMSNTTGIFSNLAIGDYLVAVMETLDNNCAARSVEQTLSPVTRLAIEQLEMKDASCFESADGEIMVHTTTDYPNELTYTLTNENNQQISNTTGNFFNLANGHYTVAVTDLNESECGIVVENTRLEVDNVPAPTTTSQTICTEEQAALTASCQAFLSGEELYVVTPNAPLQQEDICVDLQVTNSSIALQDIAVRLLVSHEWIGDISMNITSPTGTTQQLAGRVLCALDNLRATYWDNATITPDDYRHACQADTDSGYAVDGIFQPAVPLSNFSGEDPNGTWTICFIEHYKPTDFGVIEKVELLFNPFFPQTHWWDAPRAGNLLAVTDNFDPVAEGIVDNNQPGSYEFWAQCLNESVACSSQRIRTTFTIEDCNSLAVKQWNFSATPNTNIVALKWEIQATEPIDYFIIEHSTDSKHWQAIGQVAHSTTTNLYVFNHQQPALGTNFYRIKALDTNEKMTLSPIRSAALGSIINPWQISPNPSSGLLQLTPPTTIIQPTELQILNVVGQVVRQQVLTGTAILVLNDLPAGVYWVSLGTQVERWVKY